MNFEEYQQFCYFQRVKEYSRGKSDRAIRFEISRMVLSSSTTTERLFLQQLYNSSEPLLLQMIRDALSPIVELFRELAASILYRLRKRRTSGKQRKALPRTYKEYRKYKTTYGVAPGDIVFIEESESVILSIKGPPTIGAKVEYYDLNRGRKYKTGLANLFRK